LKSDQRRASPRPRTTTFARARLERRRKILAARLQRGNEPDDDPHENRDERDEDEKTRIARDGGFSLVGDEQCTQSCPAPLRDRESEDAAEQRQDDALSQQLLHES